MSKKIITKNKIKEIEEQLKPVMNNHMLKVEVVTSILRTKLRKDHEFYRFMFKDYYQSEILVFGNNTYFIEDENGKTGIENVSDAFIDAVKVLLDSGELKQYSNGRFVSGISLKKLSYEESDKDIGWRFLIDDFNYPKY